MNVRDDIEELEPLNEIFRRKLKKENINANAPDFITYYSEHIQYAENIGLGIYLFDYQNLSIHYASKLIFELFGFGKKEYLKILVRHLFRMCMPMIGNGLCI